MNAVVATPESYLKLRDLMANPNSTIDDFGAVVSADPTLASVVLNVVNSEFFGIVDKIDSVSRAINLLGIGQIYDMVLAASTVDSLEIAGNMTHSSGVNVSSATLH